MSVFAVSEEIGIIVFLESQFWLAHRRPLSVVDVIHFTLKLHWSYLVRYCKINRIAMSV